MCVCICVYLCVYVYVYAYVYGMYAMLCVRACACHRAAKVCACKTCQRACTSLSCLLFSALQTPLAHPSASATKATGSTGQGLGFRVQGRRVSSPSTASGLSSTSTTEATGHVTTESRQANSYIVVKSTTRSGYYDPNYCYDHYSR